MGASSWGFARHPKGLAPLFMTELWERFSYYGMRALLVLYLTAPVAEGGLAYSIGDSALVYGNYTMAVYMLAIPGGFIADALLGARRSMMAGGLMIMCGHFALAVPTLASFYLGLVLIALGSGLFKPSISSLVGGLYAPDDVRRDAGFSIFYMGINIGGFLAPLVTGFLAQSSWFKAWLAARGFDPAMSWHWGFAAAGVGMMIAMICFARAVRGVSTIAASSPTRIGLAPKLAALICLGAAALLALLVVSDRPGYTWLRSIFLLAPAAGIVWFARSDDLTRRRLAAVLVLFVAAMLFWAVFEQQGVSVALFADRLSRNEVAGFAFPSSWYQALNPLFVILLAPLIATLWLRLGARQPTAPVKFAIGLAFLSASFLLMVPAVVLAASGKVSPLWLVGLFLLQTIGELCLSPVGLSAMTRLAPAGWMGLVLGVWFLASAWGSKLAGVFGARFSPDDAGALVWFFLEQALMLVVATALLAALVPWIKRLMGEGQAAPSDAPQRSQ